jgi:hypothetical protein
MTDPISTRPPDDSGTDAYQRFTYQAHVAFGFCLGCYFRSDPQAIYCEHWEDLLVEYRSRLRFTQIKTRDAGRGPWRYSHLLDDGGALRSLARTHQALAALGDTRPVEYDIRLEGAVDTKDEEIKRLMLGGDGATDEMCERCARRLNLASQTARELLARVTVRPNQPARDLIAASNRDGLRLYAGHLTAGEISALYDEAIELIKRAMEADLLAGAWPHAILEPETAEEAAALRAQAKRIDHQLLEPILSRLEGGTQPLLAAVTDPDRLRATALELKLDAAGAPAGLVERAKQFRAQAAIRVAEVRGRSLFDVDAILDDLHLRLQNVADSVAEATATDPPAAVVWSELEQRLSASPASYDPHSVLSQDHLLLLGEVCQLSDECNFQWRAVP